MNKKGFTLIEVIVSVVLVSVIMVSLTSTIVELRNTYEKVKENSDVLVYSSVTSRVINKDISANEGIRYIECNTAGTECGMVLGNNSKRSLKIYDSTNNESVKISYDDGGYLLKKGSNPIRAIDIVKSSGTTKANIESCSNIKANCMRAYVDKGSCTCIKETHESTLLYEDITNTRSVSLTGVTDANKTLYIRTLSLDRMVDYKTNRVSTEGYNYLNFDVSQYSYINKHANKDLTDPTVFNVLSRLTISIYNGLDTENNTYDIVLYSSSRTDQARARVGDKFIINLNSRFGLSGSEINDLAEPYIEEAGTKYNVSSFVEKYNNGFEFTDSDHNVRSINAINPPVPKNTSKTFLGYFTGNCGGTKVIDEMGNIVVPANFFDSDTTLKACWGQMTNRVTFDPGEGINITCPSTYTKDGRVCYKNVTYGNTYEAVPSSPTKTGYKFLYWVVKNGEDYGEQIFDNSVVNYLINHTVVPMWQAEQLTLTFNTNGGSCTNCPSKTVSYDAAYGALPAKNLLSRTDYTFSGWYTEASGGEEVTSESIVNYNKGDTITLYAHWIPTNIRVVLDPNKGSVAPNELIVKYGETYGTLPEATMSGRTFAGWWTQLNGGELITSDSLVVTTSTQTLYAHWLSHTYNVLFDASGGNVATHELTVTYGEAYGTLPKPTRGLMAFKNWYTEEDCKGSLINAKTKVTQTSDHTLYACYANTYKEYELIANTNAYIINCSETTASLNSECYDSSCDASSYCSSGYVKSGAKIYVDKRSRNKSDSMLNAFVNKNDIVASTGGFNCISSGNSNDGECNYTKLYKTNHANYFLHPGYVKVRLNYVSGGASLMKDVSLADIRNIEVSTNE